MDIECLANGDPKPLVTVVKKQGRATSLVDSPAHLYSPGFFSFRIAMAHNKFFQ